MVLALCFATNFPLRTANSVENKADDIPKSIQKDTPFISIENGQVLNQKFVEKVFSSNDYFSSKKGDYITVKLKNEKAVSGNLLEISSNLLTIQSKYSVRSFNRDNIDKIINAKISNLPILKNDTNNVIKFNDGFSNEINNDKPRSFWNLLKSE